MGANKGLRGGAFISGAAGFIRSNMMVAILILIIIGASILVPGFVRVSNLLGILRSMAITGVISFFMTMVIISGEIDLSVGSTIGFSSVITTWTAGFLAQRGIMPLEYAIVIGMAASVVFCSLFGFINGVIRTRFNVPSFIITLAMLNALYGLSAIISKGFPITTVPSWYAFIGAGTIAGIVPVPAIWLLITFAVTYLIMEQTRFGREIYAVGGNPESSRLSGINVKKVKVTVMVMVQAMAAFAGIILSSQVRSGSSQFGRGYEMDVIAAVIIGGTSLMGGIGKTTGTFIGIVFLGILMNVMTLIGMDDYVKYLVRGLVILLAVLVNTIQIVRVKKLKKTDTGRHQEM